jgi:hypothetical protein
MREGREGGEKEERSRRRRRKGKEKERRRKIHTGRRATGPVCKNLWYAVSFLSFVRTVATTAFCS